MLHDSNSRTGLCSAFVDYFPRALGLIFHPVLTFSHLVREVIARVFLIEIHYCQILSSRVEKHSNIAYSNLDPAFGGIDLALEELGNKVGGLPVRYYPVDDKANPAEAINGASKLISGKS